MGTKIIIIDDDQAVRDSMRALLECCGYEVGVYASAERYLADAGGNADCLLVDHHMPGMTGLDLLERLRAAGDKTPAVLVTGRSDPLVESRAKLLGVKVLHKPVTDEDLVNQIEEAQGAAST